MDGPNFSGIGNCGRGLATGPRCVRAGVPGIGVSDLLPGINDSGTLAIDGERYGQRAAS